ncbi:MAG: transposase [Phycisphaerae bacterium]
MADKSDKPTLVERRHYPEEFKTEAIKLVIEQGYTTRQAGKQLGVPHKTLANWVRPLRKRKRSSEIAQGIQNDDPAALKAHIAELQKQLRRAEMERDILKKFSIYASSQMS